jgi:glycosyltransferase involved in cell wall biosynthesis
MNILIFSPVRLTPELDAGSRKRIYNIAKYLQNNGHKIHFVYYTDNAIDYDSFQFMQDTWDTFTVIEQKTNIQRRTGNYELDEWYEESISETVNKLVSLFQIDIVWTNYIFQSKFLEFLPEHVYKIIDTHDVFTDRYKLFEDEEDIKYTWYSYSKEDEAKGLSRADLIVAITEEEEKYFSSIVETKITVIGHLETEHFLDKKYTSLRKIGFIGGTTQVNIVAINSFLNAYFQESENKKNIQIVIAGNICDSIKSDREDIVLLGLIDETEEFYTQVDLVINPLTFGTGQKIKSVEALSYGLPILSTAVGFEGIESHSEYHQIETMDQMIHIINEIAEKPRILADLAVLSRNIFENYNKDLEEKITQLFAFNKITSHALKDLDQKEESSLTATYRKKMKREFNELIVRSQEKLLEEKTAHVLKQSEWIKKQEKTIREKTKHTERQSEWIKEQEKVIEEKTTHVLKQSVWIKEQEQIIKSKDVHIKKQSGWIIRQEAIIKETEDRFKRLKEPIKELATIRFLYHPLKKIKKYNKLMDIYHKIKNQGT